MSEEQRINVGADNNRSVIIGSEQKAVANETSRAIRRIMGAIEKYTNYYDLEEIQRDVIRDTVLNNLNRIERVVKRKQQIKFNG